MCMFSWTCTLYVSEYQCKVIGWLAVCPERYLNSHTWYFSLTSEITSLSPQIIISLSFSQFLSLSLSIYLSLKFLNTCVIHYRRKSPFILQKCLKCPVQNVFSPFSKHICLVIKVKRCQIAPFWMFKHHNEDIAKM